MAQKNKKQNKDKKEMSLKNVSSDMVFERLKKEGHIDMAIRCMYNNIYETTERVAEELDAFYQLITIDNLKDATPVFLYELMRKIEVMALNINTLTVKNIYKALGDVIDHLAEEKGIKPQVEDLNFDKDITKN